MNSGLKVLTTALLLTLGTAGLAQTSTPAPTITVSANETVPQLQIETTVTVTPASPGVPTVSRLRPALPAQRFSFELPGFGPVNVYADTRGAGRPLLLTHSVNAAASAYEMKPVWDAYAGTRPVYALEWPGFGSSARPDIAYTRDLMTRALLLLVAQLASDVDVVSMSLGSEFAARAALQDPRIRTLALLSPSGLGTPRGNTQQANADDGGQRLYNILSTFGTPLYAILRTRPVIELFLDPSFRGPVNVGLIDYAVDTSRQPGAKYAPLYFISGQLFTPDAYADLYSKLTIPVVVMSDQDAFVNFARLPDFAALPGKSAVRIADTDGLPHWEKMLDVKVTLDAFWRANP
ncbi:alpha/beta fold hydrolase [Deinococcus puniceus]|uniref:alpha/beta fold hydrolase n=1 Tax=Deinococcus puniceus TaxID=1182568 RepID=UPI000B1A4708|nr:alpha/beta fold hydrolase [Deinococcus puniceus]